MSHSLKADRFLRHDQLTWIDRQLREDIRNQVERQVRAVAEPVLLEAVDEAMRQVRSRLTAYRDADSFRSILNLQVNLSLRVSDDDRNHFRAAEPEEADGAGD